jgi:glycosyltransferase involved in cell wall biosynthesis
MHLSDSLSSLARQDCRAALEFGVIDNASTDETTAVMEGWRRRDERVRPMHEERLGRSQAMNTGAASARGSALIFTDDGVVADRDWAETFPSVPRREVRGPRRRRRPDPPDRRRPRAMASHGSPREPGRSRRPRLGSGRTLARKERAPLGREHGGLRGCLRPHRALGREGRPPGRRSGYLRGRRVPASDPGRRRIGLVLPRREDLPSDRPSRGHPETHPVHRILEGPKRVLEG